MSRPFDSLNLPMVRDLPAEQEPPGARGDPLGEFHRSPMDMDADYEPDPELDWHHRMVTAATDPEPRVRMDSWDPPDIEPPDTDQTDDRTPAHPPPSGLRRGVVSLFVLAGIGGVAIVTAMGVDLAIATARHGPSAAAPPVTAVAVVPAPATAVIAPATTAPATSPATADPAAAGCVPHRGADYTAGVGPGGTQDGPSAVLAFEYGYYVQRSGAAARAAVAPDAHVPDQDSIQLGIDRLPAGTRYCVRIRPAPGTGTTWSVDLTEQWPSQPATTFHQSITTVTDDARTLITDISDD